MQPDKFVHTEMFIWKSSYERGKIFKNIQNRESKNIVKNNCLQILNLPIKLL